MQSENPQDLPARIITLAATLLPGSLEEVRNQLIQWIGQLIDEDVQALAQLLYRVDVDENKVKSALIPGNDTAPVLADLIIERQLQKVKSRKRQEPPAEPGDDEEKW